MCDIFLVMLMLSYLNIGMSSQSSTYRCELCQGFTSFFIYCVASIIMAQMLQHEFQIEEPELETDNFSARELSVRSTPRGAMDVKLQVQHDDVSCLGRGNRLILCGCTWLLCTVFVVAAPLAPLSLQARAGGFIIYRQDPTFLELFQSLMSQSPFFAYLEVGDVPGTGSTCYQVRLSHCWWIIKLSVMVARLQHTYTPIDRIKIGNH